LAAEVSERDIKRLSINFHALFSILFLSMLKETKMKTKLFVMICGLLAAGIVHAREGHDPAQREAFRQALEACHAETGVVRPARGSHPNREDHEKMKACMSAKGLTMPDRSWRREHRRPAAPQEQEEAGAIQ
jgi:hypothetical protein